MMYERTITSRKTGDEFYFHCPLTSSGVAYIRVSINDRDAKQICAGGGFHGDTLEACSQQDFDKEVRNWYRSYTRAMDEMGVNA